MFQILQKRVFYFIILLVISILFIVNYKINSRLLYNLSSYALNTSVAIKEGIGYVVFKLNNFRESIASNFVLRERIKTLEKEILEYEQNYRSTVSLDYQISRLQQMLGFSLNTDYELLPAFLYSQDTTFPHRYLINKGQQDGVYDDNPVLAMYQNKLVFLGKIKESYDGSSLFVSVNDIDFFVPVITDVTNQIGILYGNGMRDDTMTLELDAISGIEQLFVDEVVLVNEFSKNYPPGIPIGRVVNVSYGKEDLLIRATVKPYVDIKSIDIVFIYKQ